MMITATLCALGIALFLLGIWAVHAANGPKTDRYRQLIMPPIALLYGWWIIGAFDWLNGLVQSLISLLAQWIPLLESLNTAYFASVLFNCLALLLFAILKRILRIVPDLIAKKSPAAFNAVLKPIFGFFYSYDEEYRHWFLKPSAQGVRGLLRNLYLCVIVISAVLFACCGAFPDSAAFQNPFYPVLAVLVLGEAFHWLSGITLAEQLDEIEFEADAARRIFQYARLREILKHYFGDRVLRAGARGCRRGSAGTHDDFAQKLIASSDFSTRLAGGYFKALVDRGLLGKGGKDNLYDELNHDAAANTIRLLQGTSVMFASPFYRDYIPYLFLPVNSTLLRNGKVLFLYGSEVSDVRLQEYIEEGLDFVTGVPEMWTIGELDAAKGEGEKPDVALMPLSALSDLSNVIGNADFFEMTTFVVIVDPSSLLATCQIGLGCLSEHLTRGDQPAYCIFDRNADGLVDSLSHALRVNITEVAATEFAEGTSVSMMYAADGEPLQHRLFPGVAQYLGMGTEIAAVALKGQVSKVAWASNASAPLQDLRWIVGQYYGELLKFSELPQEQLQLDEHMDFCSDMWALSKQEHRFLVVEDEYRNVFEALRQFSTRGTMQSFVNVLSPNYLLRRYMTENPELFRSDPKAVPSLAPDFSKSRRNAILSIIMAMSHGGWMIEESELVARLRYVGLPTDDVKGTLESLIEEHARDAGSAPGERFAIVVREREEYVPAISDIAMRRYYSIEDAQNLVARFSELRSAPLITEMPDGTSLLLGSRLMCHVYQSYLPGQFAVIDGKYYEIVKISEDTGVMMRRAADHFSRRRYYRQLRTYSIAGWRDVDEMGAVRTVADIVVRRVALDFAVETKGYLELFDYGDLSSAQRVEVSDVPDRSYRNKTALRLEFPGASPQTTRTVATILSEALTTLYPKDCDYLVVVSPCCNEMPEGLLPRFVGREEEEDSSVGVIYLIEDSLVDIGLVTSVDRSIQRIMELCWDFIDWHEQMLLGEPEEEPKYELGELPEPDPPAEKKGIVRRVVDWFKGIFGRKKDKGEAPAVPIENEEPAFGEAPAEDDAEAPAEGDALEENDALIFGEAPVEGEPPASNEAPEMSEPPVFGEAPDEAGSPVEDEAPEENEAPISGDAPAENEDPTMNEVLAMNEPPIFGEASDEAESPAEDEPEPPAEDEPPVEAQAPAFPDLPSSDEEEPDDEAKVEEGSEDER